MGKHLLGKLVKIKGKKDLYDCTYDIVCLTSEQEKSARKLLLKDNIAEQSVLANCTNYDIISLISENYHIFKNKGGNIVLVNIKHTDEYSAIYEQLEKFIKVL